MEVNFTNSNRLRYTVTAAVNGLGEKLPISCIFRWTKERKQPPKWAKKNPVKPCPCFYTKGGSQSGTSMLAWIKEILLPWCAANGRRSDEWVCLIMDPATAHRDAKVKKFCLENRIQIVMMPASTTYLYQMIDVVIGKPFKDAMCDLWGEWMVTSGMKTTPTGNYKSPTPMDCISWVAQAWKELKTTGVVKKAKELGMLADPGPVVEGYIERKFQDEAPSAKEADVYIAELERDFAKDEE